MARLAIASDTGMTEYRIGKINVVMASITILGRRQMAGLLHSIRIVGNKSSGMATFAATGNTGVNITDEC